MTRNTQISLPRICKYLQMHGTRPPVRRSGFSLIEIAVALGIFVFGALAIVRIFPRALGVVQNSEQRAVGQRMAQSIIAQYQNNPLSVPVDIIESDVSYNDTAAKRQENEYGWSDFPGAVFGTRNINQSLPTEPATENDLKVTTLTPIKDTSLGRFRRVLGESHIIKNGEVLLRFPYIVDTPATTADILIKQRQYVEGVVLNVNRQLDFSNARLASTGAVFNNPAIPQYPPIANYNQTFYATYSWRDAGGSQSVVDEPKAFLDPAVLPATEGLKPLQLSLFAPNTRLPNVGDVKIWFYQNGPGRITSPAAENFDPPLGRVVFNAADEGKRIFVDYTVRDWRALVVDTNLSTRFSDADQIYLTDNGVTAVGQGRQIVLPTRYITDESATNNAQLLTLLSGTVNNGGVATKSPTIRNAWLPDGTIQQDPDAPAQTSKAIGVRAKGGQVFFDINHTNGTGTQPLASPFARVVYRNIDGWSQQVAVASRSYIPYVAGIAVNSNDRKTFPREGWREYVLNNNGVLIFHAAEAGKTFEVSYTHTNSRGKRTVRNVQVTTEREIVEAVNAPATPSANQIQTPAGFLQLYKRADNTDATSNMAAIAYLPNDLGAKINAAPNEGGEAGTVDAVHSVKGISLRVRSAWYEGNGYTQTSVMGFRPLDVENWARN